MIEDPALTDPALAPSSEAARNGSDGRVGALEDRVRRLEEIVRRLEAARAPEPAPAVPAASPDPASGAVRASVGVLLDAGRTLIPAAGAVLAATAAVAEAQARAQVPAQPRRPTWLLFDLYADLRTMIRIYFDLRAPISWTGRTLPVVLLIAIATSWFWLGLLVPKLIADIPGLFTLLMKIVDLLLALVLWKAVSRAVQQYREATTR